MTYTNRIASWGSVLRVDFEGGYIYLDQHDDGSVEIEVIESDAGDENPRLKHTVDIPTFGDDDD
jgi:hypothetical protein